LLKKNLNNFKAIKVQSGALQWVRLGQTKTY